VTVAAVELGFTPAITVGDVVVRWQAAALAVLILVALAVFVRSLRRVGGDARADDIAFVLVAAVPGAVVGGRLVHGIAHWEAYRLAPEPLLDLGVGSLSLAGAVLGGLLTAGYVCRILGHRVGVWADAAAVPLLLLVGGGKLAMVLGGAGQGLPTDGPLGLSFRGDGPWWSADPALPAYPVQVAEGLWALLGIPFVLIIRRVDARNGTAGRGLALALALGWWLAGRALIAAWWRDEPWLGSLGGEGLAAVVLAFAAGATLTLLATRGAPSRAHPEAVSSGR
jgi:phosphatidylglycerol:prolipoprotein diacylglycerol transferase